MNEIPKRKFGRLMLPHARILNHGLRGWHGFLEFIIREIRGLFFFAKGVVLQAGCFVCTRTFGAGESGVAGEDSKDSKGTPSIWGALIFEHFGGWGVLKFRKCLIDLLAGVLFSIGLHAGIDR